MARILTITQHADEWDEPETLGFTVAFWPHEHHQRNGERWRVGVIEAIARLGDDDLTLTWRAEQHGADDRDFTPVEAEFATFREALAALRAWMAVPQDQPLINKG